MKVIKRIVIEVLEDLSINVVEEETMNQLAEATMNKLVEVTSDKLGKYEIYEDTSVKASWIRYNLIYLGRNSSLLDALNEFDDKINVEFCGVDFEGKLDKKGARIFALSGLYKKARQKKIDLTEGTKVRIIYDRDYKKIRIKLI